VPLNRAVKTNSPKRVLLAKFIFLRSYHDRDGRSMDGALRKSRKPQRGPEFAHGGPHGGETGSGQFERLVFFPRIATPIVGQNPVDGIGMAISGVCPGRLKIT
jgi:hypothetical protein